MHLAYYRFLLSKFQLLILTYKEILHGLHISYLKILFTQIVLPNTAVHERIILIEHIHCLEGIYKILLDPFNAF